MDNMDIHNDRMTSMFDAIEDMLGVRCTIYERVDGLSDEIGVKASEDLYFVVRSLGKGLVTVAIPASCLRRVRLFEKLRQSICHGEEYMLASRVSVERAIAYMLDVRAMVGSWNERVETLHDDMGRCLVSRLNEEDKE